MKTGPSKEQEIRRAALQRICDAAGGFRALCAARNEVLPEDERINPDYVSQILKGIRNLGEKSARTFERKLGLEPGALDQPGEVPVTFTERKQPILDHGERLTDEEKNILKYFNKIKDEDQRDHLLEIAIAFSRGEKQPAKAQDPSIADVWVAWQDQLIQDLAIDLDEYHAAKTDKAKVASAERIVDFIDRRRRQIDPPNGKLKRATDAK